MTDYLTSELIESLTDRFNEWLAGLPHCVPVSPEQVSAALEGPGSCKAADRLTESAIQTAWEGGALTAVAHVAIEAATETTGRRGVLRFVAYEPGHPLAGRRVLDDAERLFRKAGVGEILAWHYDHTYPWYHAEHALLSGWLDHVHALLGANGYSAANSEIVLDWPDYVIGRLKAPVTVELDYAWAEHCPGGLELALRAFRGGQEVAICACIGQGAFQPAVEAQDWVYVRWLHVDERLRGRGMGPYLVQTALAAYSERGYRNALVCSTVDNYAARMAYTNMGFRTVDYSWAYHKTLD